MTRHRATPAILALLLLSIANPARVQAQTPAQTVEAARGTAAATPVDLAALPATDASLTYGNPPVPHAFRGPLLWTVLTAAHLVDPARHGDAVRQTLRIQGTDGYVAVIAAGEIAPDIEGKPAILATTMDGAPLAHPRAVIPGDHRPARSVRDVARLTLDEIPRP